VIKIAILGFGTVGSGVAEVITLNSKKIAKSTGEEIGIKYIVDVRDFPGSPYEGLFTKDFSQVENDPEVKVVVETIGGAKIAYEFTKRSLLAGKSVVTSNKELVATHGYELLQIAKEKNVNYLFEASVGGGIPILRPITQCLAANKIEEVYGIVNGTTNYILTEMIKNGLSFDTALKQAQSFGYAELDPTADIEGHDACRKICILCALCFGNHVYPDKVPTEGITKVRSEDVKYAMDNGYKIKLLARAVLGEDEKVSAYVAPHLVAEGNLISGVEGVMNAITVVGNALGTSMYYGAGAGKLPTASAVVADVIDAAQHIEERKALSWDDEKPELIADPALLETKWYICTNGAEIKDAKLIAENGGEKAFITDKMDKNAALALAGENAVTMFRVLD